ncbi:MAG: pyridoxamine 5'-phosphate oxidase [Balneolaceae bacterium]|nr:MAG: pyridoxamine 5'-phosphate oxidase [Balneolaceae bacterium]
MLRYFKRWIPARDDVGRPAQAVKQGIAMLRREYDGKPFDETSADPDPFTQFESWFGDAVKHIGQDPNAMILATADKEGQPTSRTVLLKGFDEEGFVFYTNYNSRKAKSIEENPRVSLTFYWPDLMRQIQVHGTAEKVPPEISDEYFNSRPDGSKLGAWASDQSSPISSRYALEEQLKQYEETFRDTGIPRPPHWGGYRVVPFRIEFWQGRLNRLHDRISYRNEENGRWIIERLSP